MKLDDNSPRFLFPRPKSPLLLFAVFALGLLDLPSSPAQSGGQGFIASYQARVSATQAEQPHWVTPLVTVTPRLEQELRTDFVHQYNNKGFGIWNYGNSKGLELIPERHIEIIINAPPFFNRSNGESDGFGDVSFLAKGRIYSRNEEHGNAIVTAFFAGTIPTGKNGNGSCCAVVTPTLAVGKGFGQFALTSTAGGSLPVTNSKGLGHTITWNNAIQYRLAKTGLARLVWPELEFNSSFYKGGTNDGENGNFCHSGSHLRAHTANPRRNRKAGQTGPDFRCRGTDRADPLQDLQSRHRADTQVAVLIWLDNGFAEKSAISHPGCG